MQIIGFVQGQGTTQDIQNYAYTDLVPQAGVNYYRLKQVDLPDGQAGFDEKYEYTNVVNVEVVSSSEAFRLFPNPIMDELNIINGQGVATIYNSLGQLTKEFNINKNQITIDVNDLPKGQYWLNIIQENGNVITQQFVK